MTIIIEVALPVPLMSTFNYQLPSDLNIPQKGSRVLVQFSNRMNLGIVISHNYIDIVHQLKEKNLKNIEKVLDKQSLFSDSLWSLLIWASQYYHYPIGEVLFQSIPVLLRQGKDATFFPFFQWQITEEGKKYKINQLKRSPKQQQALKLFQKYHILDNYQLSKNKFRENTLHSLKKRDLIKQLSVPVAQKINNWNLDLKILGEKPKLNLAQLKAIKLINSKLTFITWLLVGITGSGKTEVYLSVIENIILQGKQALVLVPEISLIFQTIQRFRGRFNAPIDILHSSISDNERLEVWLRAKKGHNAVIIGTRSALFTNFYNLGLIIIDEEHDNSYKQPQGWRYHARDLAVLRAKQENIPIIMGSATPSLESLYNIKKGKYNRLDLNQRAGNAKPASQYLLDLTGQQLKYGMSKHLINRMKNHLTENNQVMLFLNRRGYSTALICHNCGWIAECFRCNKNYTLHYYSYKLMCHHCSSTVPIPIECRYCDSTNLITIGLGTEQLEKAINTIFPNIPITRIDRDTTRRKGTLEKELTAIYTGGARILIGTQMLSKGHHFPDVTLVALLNVDGALFSSDYRATEKFAQLYTQVSGRAGRSGKYSEVILQTYYPKHPLISTLLKKGYNEFAMEILAERNEVSLPPHSSHIIIRSEDYHNDLAICFLSKIRKSIEQHNMHMPDSKIWLMGPIPAILAKRAGRFRWQLLLQHHSRSFLQQFFSSILSEIIAYPESKKVKWNIDVNLTLASCFAYFNFIIVEWR